MTPPMVNNPTMPPNDTEAHDEPANIKLERRIATLEAISPADLEKRLTALETTIQNYNLADLSEQVTVNKTTIKNFLWTIAVLTPVISFGMTMAVRAIIAA